MIKLGLYASIVSVVASVIIYVVLDDSQLAIYIGSVSYTHLTLPTKA